MAISERELAGCNRSGRMALTESERRLLVLLAMGLTLVEAAWQLALTPTEVLTTRARLHHRLGVTSDEELVPFAARHGLTC